MAGRRVHPILKAVTVLTLFCFIQFSCLTPLFPALSSRAWAQDEVDTLLEDDELDLLDDGDAAEKKDAEKAPSKEEADDEEQDEKDEPSEEDRSLLDAAEDDDEDDDDDEMDEADDDDDDDSELMIRVDFNHAAPAVNGPKKILILFNPSNKKIAGELAQLNMATNLWLREHPEYTVVPVNEALKDKGALNEQESIAQGNTLFQEAKSAYEALDFDTVIEKAPKAIKHYLPFAYYPEHKKRLVHCLHLLAAAYQTDEEEDLAKETFARALNIDRQAGLDPIFPPGVQKMYVDLREQMEFQSKGSVKILSKPDRIPVFFDGAYLGLTPIAERKISAGEHYLQTELPGFQDYRSTFRVYPDTSKTLQLSSRRVAKYYQYQGELADVLENMDHLMVFKNVKRLHRLTGVDNLLFVDVQPGVDATVFRGMLYDMEAKTHRYHEVSSDLVALVVDKVYPAFLDELFSAEAEDNLITQEMLAARKVEREKTMEKDKTDWYESWWFWTIIGTVVVGTAVGVGVGLGMKDDSEKDTSNTPSWDNPNAIRITF